MRSLGLLLFLWLYSLHLAAAAPTSDGGAMTSDPLPDPEPSDSSLPESTSIPSTEPPEPTPPPVPSTSPTLAPESESEPNSESISTPESASTPDPTSTPPDFSSTTEPSTITSSDWVISTDPAATMSTASPSGEGQICVQQCFDQAAANAGCNGFDDTACICQSSYIEDARNCFNNQPCPIDSVQTANQDYSTLCTSFTQSEIATSTTDTAIPPSLTPLPSLTPQPSPAPSLITRTSTPTSRHPESTVRTVQTFVIQSGAVITVSNTAYTAGGVLTTTVSGQMGDFVGGAGVTRLGANQGFATSVPNSELRLLPALVPVLPIFMMSTVIGIVFGGLACLMV